MIKQKVMTERERGYIEGTIATAVTMSKKGEKKRRFKGQRYRLKITKVKGL